MKRRSPKNFGSIESLALWQEIAERLPDYVFARVTLARLYLINKETDAAETLLKPLLKSRFTRQDILAQ